MLQFEAIGKKQNNFKNMENIKIEEKIDYIYNRLKKQEKQEKMIFFFKLFVTLFLVWFLAYMYHFWINMIINWATNNLKTNITDKVKNFWDNILNNNLKY